MKENLLVVGHINMDTIHTQQADATESPGGGAMYMAFAASVYGEPVDLLSTRCSDVSEWIFDQMHQKKINTDNVLPILGKQRRSSMSYTADFKRTNLAHATGSWLEATIEQVPRHLPLRQKKYDVVYLAQMLAANQLLYAKWAKAQGATVALDISEYYAKQNLSALLECLQFVDIFMPSTVELDLMFPEYSGDIDAIAKQIRKSTSVNKLVVKCASEGSRIYDFCNRQFVSVGIHPVGRIVDATGAGDSYNGGFLSYWMATGNAVLSAKYAAVVAGACIQDFSFRNLLNKNRNEIEALADTVPAIPFDFSE